MARLDRLIDNLKAPTGATNQTPWYWPLRPPPGRKEPAEAEWALQLQEGFAVELFLHAADIASPAMPFDQFARWNQLVTDEFLEQGDLELAEVGHLISPPAGFSRDATPLTQHGFTRFFIQFLSRPIFEKMNELTRIGVEPGSFRDRAPSCPAVDSASGSFDVKTAWAGVRATSLPGCRGSEESSVARYQAAAPGHAR